MANQTKPAGTTSLSCITFGENPAGTATGSFDEIKQKGFNTLIWHHKTADAGTTLTPDEAAAFSAGAARAGLSLWLETSSLLNPPAVPAADGEEQTFTDGEITDPEVRSTLVAALSSLKDGGCVLQGILVPVLQRLNLPHTWYAAPAFLQSYAEKNGGPWPDELAGARKKGPVVETAAWRNYRRHLTALLAAALKDLKKECTSLFGPDFTVQIYSGAPDSPIGLTASLRFDPMLAGSEQTELPHAEEVDRRPAPVIGRLKTLGGIYAAGSAGDRHTRIWGEDYGTQRASHSPDVLSYWTDLACTFHVNPVTWAFAPDSLAFTRTVKKGVSFPAHPGWKQYAALTKKTEMVRTVTGNAAGCAPLGVIYPVSTLTAFPEKERRELQQAFHTYLYRLLRTGYIFEVIPDTWLGMGQVKEKKIVFNKQAFTGIIYPFARFMEPAGWNKIRDFAAAGGTVMFTGLPPRALTDGTDIVRAFSSLIAANLTPDPVQVLRYKGGNEIAGEITTAGSTWGKPGWEAKGGSTFLMADDHPVGVQNGTVSYLGLFPAALARADLEKVLTRTGFTRTITFPSSAYLNVASDDEGLIFSLCPAEMNGIINGEVETDNIKFEIIECPEVMAIRFRHGTGEIISHALFGDTEVRVEH